MDQTKSQTPRTGLNYRSRGSLGVERNELKKKFPAGKSQNPNTEYSCHFLRGRRGGVRHEELSFEPIQCPYCHIHNSPTPCWALWISYLSITTANSDALPYLGHCINHYCTPENISKFSWLVTAQVNSAYFSLLKNNNPIIIKDAILNMPMHILSVFIIFGQHITFLKAFGHWFFV